MDTKSERMKFVIVGKKNCPWCDRVKVLIAGSGYEYTYIELTGLPGDVMRTFLVDNSLTTVPQVFQHGYHIGGFKHTEEYIKNVQAGANLDPCVRVDDRGADGSRDLPEGTDQYFLPYQGT